MRVAWAILKGPWLPLAALLWAFDAWGAEPDYAALVQDYRNGSLIPGYERLAREATVLDEKIGAACEAAPTDDASLAVRDQFHKTLDAWQAVQHIRHGAAIAFDRHARLQFWPDKRGRAGKHLARLLASEDTAQLEAASFADGSVAVQGFPALERLLFGTKPLSPEPHAPEKLARCDVAQAITSNLAAIADKLVAETKSPVAKDDPKAIARALMTDLAAGFQVISELKLKSPVGKTKPRYRRAENWRSERSLKNVEINLNALRDLAVWLYGRGQHDGEMQLVLKQFAALEMKLKKIPDAVRPVLDQADGRDRLLALAANIEELNKLTVSKLAEHLKLGVGFNSFDGD